MKDSVRIDHWQAQELQNRHIFEQRELLVWTVYEHPLDYPEHFIARPHAIRPLRPLLVHLQADTLEALRGLLPQQLHREPRAPSDPASVVETWF